MVAAEDYKGLSPNKTAYDTAPRYLDEHVAALQANGYTVETLRRRQPAGRPERRRRLEAALATSASSKHFDAVVYYTGDDLLPQAEGEGVTETNYRRGNTPAANGHVRAHRLAAPGPLRACATPRCCATT